jgi:nucleoside-diphosphate-sugar epimerase
MSIRTISVLGSGWLGLPLIESLVNSGYSVKGSTTSVARRGLIKELNAEPFVIDIENSLGNINSFLQSEVVIINIPSKNELAFNSLLSAIKQSPVKKVVFVSSISVYRSNNEIVTESSGDEIACHPLIKIETLFRESPDIKTTIIRFGGLVGPNRHPGRFFTSGKIVKDPDAVVNLIHRDDCLGIIRSIIEKECWGELFNGCSNSHPTKRVFYTSAAKSIGQNPLKFEESGLNSYKLVCSDRLKLLLNYLFTREDLI